MRPTTITNTSDLSDKEVIVLILSTKQLGVFKNVWRQRYVQLIPHPSKIDEVITIGVGFGDAIGTIAICNGPRSMFDRQLVNGDWGQYL